VQDIAEKFGVSRANALSKFSGSTGLQKNADESNVTFIAFAPAHS
jgi:hypothetical protein